MNKHSFQFENSNKDNSIIDTHVHLPSPDWPHHKSFFTSVDAAINYLKNTGISTAVFNTWQGAFSLSSDDVHEANNDTLSLTQTYSGLLYPGAIIHPQFVDKSKYWLSKFRDLGFIWVGELVSYKHGYPYMSTEFVKLFEICAKHHHIVQLHQHDDIIKLANYFPELRIVCSHIPQLETMIELSRHKNVWLDISGSCGGLVIGQLEKAIEIFGIDRILFGTDFDGYEPAAFIARVKCAVNTAIEQKKVFSGNFINLLNL